MKVVLLAIISVALGHDHHEHKNHHHHLRGADRPITMPGHSDHFCGESPFPKDFEPVVSLQDYYGPARRKLQYTVKQAYDHAGNKTGCCPHTDSECSNGHFMDAEDAKKAGLTGPLRVTFVYDLVNVTGSQLADVGMCHKEGTHKPKYCSTGRNGDCITIKCDAEEKLVTPNKVSILHDRLEWVREYLLKTFEVRKVQDDIVIQKNTLQHVYYDRNNELPPVLNLRYSNTDLVILMSMNPPISAGVAGWAQCLQKDQWGRCTVGLFNFVATTITGNPIVALAPNVISSERSTSLHETMHVLGLKSQTSSSGFFRKKNGCAMEDAELFEDGPQSEGTMEDGFVTKRVRHWKTPKVLELARQQFGCDTLKGVPMEDVKMGYLAHWEARVMGPDVMSYGIGSGEAYISDITLAYFADSGHYLVKYMCTTEEVGTCGGGRMTKYTGKDEAIAQKSLTSTLFSEVFAKEEHKKAAKESTMQNISVDIKTPGYIRWGRHQGCDFVNKKPTPSNWGKKYTCETPDEYGCTPDNRMSSACYLRTYGTDTNVAARDFPCPPGGRNLCTRRTDPGLPADYRYFTGKDSQLGGYGESMDYAPVRLGYWNCLDAKPKLTGTIKAVEGQDVDYGKAFDKLEQRMPEFGGQVYSSKSRCFRSSLIGFSEFHNINPEWPAYGLCYVTNCYTEDYLQFGLQDFFGGIKWYSCQGDAEKKISIPLYFGFIYCPNVTQFCEMEPVTGKFFNENNHTVEWIVWIVVAAVIIILLILFCCVKPIRQNCAKCLKSAVGFERASKHAADVEKTKCQKFLPKVLMALCGLWNLLGFASVITAVAILAAPQMFKNVWDSASRNITFVLFLGIMAIILASFGYAGARASGPTLKMCFYFYILICILLVLILLGVSAVWINSLLKVLFDALWDSIRTQFPTSMIGMTSAQAWDQILVVLEKNAMFIIPVVVFIYLSNIVGIVVSGVVLTCRNIMGTMSFFCQHFADGDFRHLVRRWRLHRQSTMAYAATLDDKHSDPRTCGCPARGRRHGGVALVLMRQNQGQDLYNAYPPGIGGRYNTSNAWRGCLLSVARRRNCKTN